MTLLFGFVYLKMNIILFVKKINVKIFFVNKNKCIKS